MSAAIDDHRPIDRRSRWRLAAAHFLAGAAGTLSPWWRFRVWARLAGPAAYDSDPSRGRRLRRVWPHQSLMELREADWMERYAARCGRYYQDDLIATLMQELRSGETFVDIGANVGFVTLTAARLVGPQGRVISVEANAALVERLRETLRANGVQNVEVHNVALGATSGEVALVSDGHHGTAHIDLSREGGELTPLRRGDDVIGDVPGPVFVKIDVEGAEAMVLEGLPRLLARQDVRWLIEVCASHLARFGAGAETIFDRMAAAGYRPYEPRLSPFSRKVRLHPLESPQSREIYDVFFARPG